MALCSTKSASQSGERDVFEQRQAQDWDGQIRIAAVRGLAVLDRQAAGRLLLREFDTRFVGGMPSGDRRVENTDRTRARRRLL